MQRTTSAMPCRKTAPAAIGNSVLSGKTGTPIGLLMLASFQRQESMA